MTGVVDIAIFEAHAVAKTTANELFPCVFRPP